MIAVHKKCNICEGLISLRKEAIYQGFAAFWALSVS